MTTKEKYWKYSLVILILVLGVLMITELWSFVSGLLGAFTIFVLVRRQMVYLMEKKKIHKILAAAVILLEVMTCIVVPVCLVVWALFNKMQDIDMDISRVTDMIRNFDTLIETKFGYDLMSIDNLTMATGYLSKGLQIVINQTSGLIMTLVVMIFFLYFILVDYQGIEKYVYNLLPFSEKNRNDVVNEIYRMVRSNAIGIPLLAFAQGTLAYVGYLIFDVPSTLLFALLTCFASIIPIVGTGLVWVPLSIYLALTGHWVSAIGLAAYSALILTNVDNVIRFILQKKLADTHPLITVFGVIFGLSVFGFWGIIFGPLLMSLFFLLVNIFKREYLDGGGA
ncbi:MAG: AI-2E family transporter [Tannerella sp.]|jgi:predicted PurR-regulated permease PerM|nr:AI-2E family transporter [Tannerella sp.]